MNRISPLRVNEMLLVLLLLLLLLLLLRLLLLVTQHQFFTHSSQCFTCRAHCLLRYSLYS